MGFHPFTIAYTFHISIFNITNSKLPKKILNQLSHALYVVLEFIKKNDVFLGKIKIIN
jgi:hypothetical protein